MGNKNKVKYYNGSNVIKGRNLHVTRSYDILYIYIKYS